ncbi:MAG: hypothetical protein COV74_07635 [Candidatus Omnitrophica bacterium CG11_big_fil_rev_8_21_14_0_20_45_26]|uniref:S-isoprenylcysteine methyltransferase n=1 Tax=Candidatus Abzuiibacterium crystallinum TaxID=1974748 RepID=A0A2H0LQB5_9BACT|nr:MAG: hypothetical protein COV74_07635 [Candidatus Omnitrophica bacterium CG11_big_fil_rev_8_21_14_0_20_45_26]PIW65201.1 MAG: hypothetical protein COW12_03240 [Candidatus Omnitrophica bacterium CG12_big_fil_rev_8_21_14_0_65_45_16]
MNLMERLRTYPRFQFKKFRILLAWVGGILLMFSAKQMTDTSFRIGVPFICLGELIRIWSLGCMARKGVKLAAGGPYAFVRNPLYIGNLLIGLGTVLVFQNRWLLLIFLIGFPIVYSGTVRKEESDLEQRLGDEFRRYKDNVPRFLPRLTPYQSGEKEPFLWSRLIQHHEYITIAAILLCLMGLYILKTFVTHQVFGPGQWVSSVIALLLASYLVIDRAKRIKRTRGQARV